MSYSNATSGLREKQSLFLYNIGRLIIYAFDELHIELTGGELYRTEEQQRIYLMRGLSKARRSRHQDKLAMDFNVFVDRVYRSDNEAYKKLAEYWQSLHPDNVAGYYWGWDSGHFEMKP